MSNEKHIDDSGPWHSRPMQWRMENAMEMYDYGAPGVSIRVRAAIELRQPDSGIDWLDEMILRAKRDELAGQAMAATIANPYIAEAMSEVKAVATGGASAREFEDQVEFPSYARASHNIAYAMIAEKQKREGSEKC